MEDFSGHPDEDKSKKITDRVRVNIWLPKKLISSIEDICREDVLTMTSVIREAINVYVSKRKKKI